ncbi:MAG: histidine kinase [Cyclobacteriaceae bacterium]
MSAFQIKYRYIYIFTLSAYSYLNIKFTESDSLVEGSIGDISLAIVILFFTVLIWETNRISSFYLYKNETLKVRHKPLIIHFVCSIFFVILISVIGHLLVSSILSISNNTGNTLKLMIGFTFRINLFLHCINAIVYYWKQGSKFQLEAERFKKQSAEAQYDALRKQVNPHFLFNSFNVLSSLIPTDQQTASRFVDQLSVVYRYLLKNQHNKLIRLEEELHFLNAYIYLMKIRFRDNLIIINDIPDHLSEHYVVPSSLQLLIENAIKHNEVSKRSPLIIKLYEKNSMLVVENDIHLKQQKTASSKVGLDNIKKRYAFLDEENPVIIHSDKVFTVQIPLINPNMVTL